MRDRALKNVFIGFCVLSVLFPLLNIVYIQPSFERAAREMAERKGAAMTRHLVWMLLRDGAMAPRPEMEKIVRRYLVETGQALKVKVYTAGGEVLYAFPAGAGDSAPPGPDVLEALRQGREFSEFKPGGSLSSEGAELPSDMLEVYVPISGGGDFIGALEIYYDVTGDVKLLRAVHIRSIAVMAALIVGAYLAVSFMLLRATRSEGEGQRPHFLSIRSPLYQLLVLALSVFFAEFIVMLLLDSLSSLPPFWEAALDSVWLVILVSPLLYFFVLRPLRWLVTSLERTTGELDAMVRQREKLMLEVVDRVRGNLHMVSSMLSMQARKLGDAGAAAAVLDSERRVRAMGMVHEMFYNARDVSGADAAEFLQSLGVRLFRSMQVEPNKVRLMFELDHAPMDADSAISCGLVLNELLSNALRHAFPGQRKGEVMVSFKADAARPGTYVFSVSDNGVGAQEKFDIKNPETLGLKLVNALVGDLGGELHCDCHEGGARIAVTFSLPRA